MKSSFDEKEIATLIFKSMGAYAAGDYKQAINRLLEALDRVVEGAEDDQA
jgi:hypothetical protein